MGFEIQKSVPPPSREAGASKWPWPQMDSGDSVLIPIPPGQHYADFQRSISNSAREFLRKHRPGWRVLTRREGQGVRIWLVDQSEGASTGGDEEDA